jgi:branched-chain amino acid transport system permease protein
MGAVLGLFLGLLTLRLRGIYVAVVSWFLGLALLGLARNLTDLTRGSLGLLSPSFFDGGSNRPYYFVAIVMLMITFVTLVAIVESRTGLAFEAIGQNYDAARASGINPARYRLLSLVVSCMFAGWLGGFYAHYYGILTPQVMGTAQTVTVLVIVYLGGRGTLWGPAVIAFPFVIFTENLKARLSDLPGLDLVIYGALLTVIMLFYPHGFAGAVRATQDRLARSRWAAGWPVDIRLRERRE